MGIILATGLFMILKTVVGSITNIAPDIPSIIILFILIFVIFLSRKFYKKELSPLLLIIISAVMGIVLYKV